MYISKKANSLESRDKKSSIRRLEDLTLFIKSIIIDSSSIEIDKKLA